MWGNVGLPAFYDLVKSVTVQSVGDALPLSPGQVPIARRELSTHCTPLLSGQACVILGVEGGYFGVGFFGGIVVSIFLSVSDSHTSACLMLSPRAVNALFLVCTSSLVSVSFGSMVGSWTVVPLSLMGGMWN